MTGIARSRLAARGGNPDFHHRLPGFGRLWSLAVATLICAATGVAVGEETAVAPGGVVVWPGERADRCGIGARGWTPLSGACWYPIDLLQAAGDKQLWRDSGGVRETRTVTVADYPYPVQRITLQDDSKVNLSSADLARSREESSRVAALWPIESPRRFELPLSTPLAEMPEGGRFGSRRIFNDQPRSPHTGADYGAAAGTEVRSVADGRVLLAEEHFFAGKSVFVDHGDGLISMYFHLSRILVSGGTEVERDQALGRVGESGRASGPHLHFGLRWHGARVDPELLLGSLEEIPRIR